MSYRVYEADNCISFMKTDEPFGGLSNMASGYPIVVNDVYIRTSEALYQALRFTEHPNIQQEIIDQKSPMTAKMVAKQFQDKYCRSDWQEKRVTIMRWCLWVKLVQNLDTFEHLLLSTGQDEIVEESYKDDFWGARKVDEHFQGTNALGRLLMELRNNHREKSILSVEPLLMEGFQLMGKDIGTVVKVDDKEHFIRAPRQGLLF